MYNLSKRSVNRMAGLHPDLIRVVSLAIGYTEIDFAVTEGMRSAERQEMLVAEGKSMTLHSKHLSGRAVDVVALIDGKASWDMEDYKVISVAFKKAAKELDIAIEWGGDWKNFKDGVHFELQ